VGLRKIDLQTILESISPANAKEILCFLNTLIVISGFNLFVAESKKMYLILKEKK
jgi:hypothetical protein